MTLLSASAVASATTYEIFSIDSNTGKKMEVGIYTVEGKAEALSLADGSGAFFAMDKDGNNRQIIGKPFHTSNWIAETGSDTLEFHMLVPDNLASHKDVVIGYAGVILNGNKDDDAKQIMFLETHK